MRLMPLSAVKVKRSGAIRVQHLRNRALQRDIIFTITLEQFRQWCVKVDYIGFAGRSSESYTIDRKHNDIGYHIDNIQVLTKAQNITKYFSYDYRTKTAVVGTLKTADSEPDYF